MSANDQLEKARRGELVRRNIHTYPFKYTVSAADDFFEPDLGSIYIHIPFCSTKCHFCDYTVYINSKQDLRTAYVEALKKEIRQFTRNRAFPAFRIDAIYFGGGTPGLLEAEQLVDILDTCRDAFAIVEAPEIAIEFDPHSVDADKLARLSEAGFNRVSIGAQAFDDEMRDKLLKHKERRGALWKTIEEPLDIGRTLATISGENAVLVDCATMWLSNHLLAENDLAEAEAGLMAGLALCAAPVVIVSNEVGASIVPENALARKFRDAQGRLNQKLAAKAGLVINVVAGLPQVLKGELR